MAGRTSLGALLLTLGFFLAFPPAATTAPSRGPAIDVFRIRYDEPGFRAGVYPGPWSGGFGSVRARGTVWFENVTTDRLDGVRLIVHFYSRRFNRESDACVYEVGAMDGKQRMSVNFACWVQPFERPVPYVEMTWRVHGSDAVHRAVTQPAY